MDGNRFDDLVRNLATPTTRRNALRSLIGGVAVVAGISRRHDALAVCGPEGPFDCAGDEDCIPSDSCHTGHCTFIEGGCSVCSFTAKQDGATCDDGNLCTLNDTCQAGACVPGTQVFCPPPSQCYQVGSCNPSTGVCSSVPKPNGSPCDDGNLCTLGDACFNGICVGSIVEPCPPTDSCHTAGVCNPATGRCSNPAVPDGSPCDSGTVCDGADTCQGGICTGGTPLNCTTSNPCMTSSCDPDAGCVETPKPAGTACGDGDACNGNETCDGAGVCRPGTPVTCGECTLCNAATGTCDAAHEGESCFGDGSLCFGSHTCQSGSCVGVNPVVCTPLDQCHVAGTCNASTGICTHPTKPTGASCSDGNACTTGETCQNGVCGGGTAVTCPPVTAICKVSAGCNATTGLCGTANAPDGTPCNGNGSCLNGACLTCGKNEEFCGGICRAKNSYGKDERNCGACGHVCPPNYICKGSFCTPLK